MRLAQQKMSKLEFECVGCRYTFPDNKDVKKSLFYTPVLVCSYRPKPYSRDKSYKESTSWYKSVPEGLQSWIDEDHFDRKEVARSQVSPMRF